MAELVEIDDLIRDDNSYNEAERSILERTIVLDETVETAQLAIANLEEGGVDENSAEEPLAAGDCTALFPEDSFNSSYPFMLATSSTVVNSGQQQIPDYTVPFELQQPTVEEAVCSKAGLQKPKEGSSSSVDPSAISRLADLRDISGNLLQGKKKTQATLIQEEFFGVYCLISRSEMKQYKNRCYIGYTVDPNRRIRQHNAGKQRGGAKKTDSRGPWDMVCIIHGFPNAVSALRFEWAWQNPEKSRRLRDLCDLKKKGRKETPFQFRLRIVGKMLNSDPWQRLALTVRWLLPECELPFPADSQPPVHMRKERGQVEKFNIVVPDEITGYAMAKQCSLCQTTIAMIKHLLRCPSINCAAHYHARCLAEDALKKSGDIDVHLVPQVLDCPECGTKCFWSDLVRDQHNLLLVDSSKPKHDGVRIATGMIPIRMEKR